MRSCKLTRGGGWTGVRVTGAGVVPPFQSVAGTLQSVAVREQ